MLRVCKTILYTPKHVIQKTVTWNFLFSCKHILHFFVISGIVASKQTNKETGVQKYAYVTNGTELNFIKCNQIIL